MADTAPWIRLQTDWMNAEWLFDEPDDVKLTWVFLVCYCENASKLGGIIRRVPERILADAIRRPESCLRRVLELGTQGDNPAIVITDSTIEIQQWQTFHPTSSERTNAYRERKRQAETRETPATPVTLHTVTETQETDVTSQDVSEHHSRHCDPTTTTTTTTTTTDIASKEASGVAAEESQGGVNPPILEVVTPESPPGADAPKTRAANHAFDPVLRVLIQAAESQGWDPPEAKDVNRAIGRNSQGALPLLIDRYGEDGALAMFIHCRSHWSNPQAVSWEAIYGARDRVREDMARPEAEEDGGQHYTEDEIREMVR